MNLLDGMKHNATIQNSKGGLYYRTSYDDNLDLFAKISRFNSIETVIRTFKNALLENQDLALANLLFLLDIRNGKGERRLFKTLFTYLCFKEENLALKILPFISQLGRYDYILCGLHTPIENDVIKLVHSQLNIDLTSDHPSLLAKWLPSHRTHGKDNPEAKYLRLKLGLNEKEYRQLLSKLRGKLNLIESNLTNQTYENISFESVPSKAMMKYSSAFQSRMPEQYQAYLQMVKEGKSKINTSGLYCYEIIKKALWGSKESRALADVMWENQKDVLEGCNSNILVMADTSGSMACCDGIPLANSIGLAIYTAQRNTGYFKNHFMTFSSHPQLCEIKGNSLKEITDNIPYIIENTDIDAAFKLLLDTATSNFISQKDMPSHIIIISDMEFDQGVYSQNDTNLAGWKKAFKKAGYQLPKIIFWNVACHTNGLPTTKFDQDVCMISGFSTNVLENLFNLENLDPMRVMWERLGPYVQMLQEAKKDDSKL